MRRLLGFIMPVALAGCATGIEGPQQDPLVAELAGRVAGAPESCIPAATGQGLTIVDQRTLTYRSGGTIWVNRLKDDCPGMRPLNTLIVEVHGSRFCRGDHVQALQPGLRIPGPVCILQDFTPYRRAG